MTGILKASRSSLVDQVVAQMESLIDAGEWPVGERIPTEMELVAEFGVSRNTLREAVRALVHAGLLQSRQGSGTVVRSSSMLEAAIRKRVDRADVLDTLEVRHALEREAARLAAIRRNPEDLEELQSALILCKDALVAGDAQRYLTADLALHRAIVEASHNEVLIELYGHLIDPLEVSIRNIFEASEEETGYIQVHGTLVDAVIRQDPGGAMDAVNVYINRFKETLSDR
ncbi:FadR/GntR family transcriptional regulator [Edaphobacillus lindanitolerans]|uniref:DNA-binding transcriptional regulator, FadR family n=1 Tax=Edaphobacillus lindanitolerans TaxID=550447 RepID=A0A1U7PMN9_9BACI|nr:FadR/GntR family transcriptional regulator [Edaphobacillus lindanitolerans]SIT72241.1 DNA-binding transcriptional regulator, FadR family [Edaphobacillus lindanitolerans]